MKKIQTKFRAHLTSFNLSFTRTHTPFKSLNFSSLASRETNTGKVSIALNRCRTQNDAINQRDSLALFQQDQRQKLKWITEHILPDRTFVVHSPSLLYKL